MPAAMPLQSQISQDYQHNSEFRVDVAQYGGGYEQRVKNGINNVVDNISLTWAGLSATDYATLVAAMAASEGTDYFTYTLPGDSAAKKWVLNGTVNRKMRAYGVFSVTLPFRQVFDI
jgi:phage-related protein